MPCKDILSVLYSLIGLYNYVFVNLKHKLYVTSARHRLVTLESAGGFTEFMATQLCGRVAHRHKVLQRVSLGGGRFFVQ